MVELIRLHQNSKGNPGEIAGDRIDNDRNGYVDDLFGWNFGAGQNNNNVLPGTRDPGQAHGTHVAGTIAAEYNGFGTTGVAPNAKIMALRISDVRGNRFTNPGNLAEAIRYAVNNGAKVINMSLGWTESPELINALNYAASRNVITVSAAGNSGLAAPAAPAKYATHLGISVGAIDFYGRIATFSNRAGFDSRMQHVVAPGVGVWSTMPTNFSKWYDTMNGTSMAAPHVAGVIALMLQRNRSLTQSQILDYLTKTARRDSFTGASPNATWGYGKLDAKAAVDLVTPPQLKVVSLYEYHAQDPAGRWRFFYSRAANVMDGWTRSGREFLVIGEKAEDAIPVYRFSADTPWRFQYSRSINAGGDGWHNDGIAFYAYANAAFNRRPIYQYSAPNPWRFRYSPEASLPDPGWRNDGVAFYIPTSR
ncbi:S8 family serine peptidase [Leptolyngbya sp. 7M]|uniref:S8 family serine peptidase n=1 Tax=Leptolyngbya sp. 7M TaxID=2812896 RepID=UPI001CED0AB1|nr:S8 family serine peptidase [Leptolyngbya sp. 7M]